MKQIAFCVIIFILTFTCSQPEEVKPDPPEVVQVVLRTTGADTLDIEQGIDAAENLGDTTNAIQIMWYTHPSQSELDNFTIYRSEHESGLVNYYPIGSIEVGQQGQIDTVFNDTQNLVIDRQYFYFITAIDEDGQESENSDTLSYMLLEKADDLILNGNEQEVVEPVLNFGWQNPGRWPNYFYLRIEANITDDFHPLVYIDRVQNTYIDWQDYHIEGDWLKTVFENGRYRWRVDCEGEENIAEQRFSGSESDWSDFTVNWSN